MTLPPPPGRHVHAPHNIYRGGGWDPFREAMAEQGAQEAMAEHVVQEAMAAQGAQGPWWSGLRGLG